MTHDELVADTNQLIRQLLEREAAAKAESERFLQESRSRLAEIRGAKPNEAPEDLFADMDARRKEATAKAQENLKVATQREADFKDELLAELRIQSDLLRQIAEKLGA